MTIRFETLTSTIDAAPGETVGGKIRLSNESSENATVAVRVIGVGPGSADATSGEQVVHLPAGETLDVDVPIVVPDLLGIGQHAAAFEVRTRLQGPLLGSFILSVPSVERILIETVPGTIRGKRRPKFILDLTNNEAQPVTFVVDGSANNVRVRFEEDHFQLAPGERASTRAKVRGPRRVFGQPTQHNLLLSARGVASSAAITTPYIQRPLIASRIRSIVAAITVVALWAGGMVGLYQWDRSQQADSADQSSLTVDADGTGQELTSPSDSGATGSDPATSTDGSGSDNNTAEPTNSEPATSDNASSDSDSDSSDSSDSSAGSDNAADKDQASKSSDQAAASTPTSTTVTGTITLATDDAESSTDALDGVVIKLRELQLGEAPPAQSVPQGFAARSADQPTKLWSARRSTAASELGRIRQTTPVTREGLPNGLGIWLFGEVQLQRTYELAFQKAGFQSQSFVIEPSDDGTLVKVDVNLAPGEGSIVGTLTGPPAGQRNATISITDGTIEYATTAASDTGSWQIEGLSTPAVYTLTASLPGYGTVVQQVTLQTGEQDLATNVVLQPGVATVRGQVFGPEGGVGGAVITIAGRGEPRTTTTLTEGNVGAYSISGFDIDASNPQAATITVEQDGFNRESTTRVLNRSDVSGVNFLLTGDRLRLSGVVRSSDDNEPIAGASLKLSTGDLTFSAQTSSGTDSGEFDVADLPPGDYVITVAAFGHVTSYEFVTLVEGIAPDRLNVTLQGVDPNDALNQLQADLIVSVVDPEAATQATREVKGAVISLIDTASGDDYTKTNDSSNEVRFTVPIGTYTVAVIHVDYNPAPRREVTVGLTGATIEVEVDKKLKASARVVDSVSGLPLKVDAVTVFRRPDVAGEAEQDFKLTVNDDGEWTTVDALPAGSYRIESSLEGYRIRNNQVLDSTLDGADNVYQFEIRDSLTEQLVLNDIRADPYARVSGRVFKPTVDNLGVVGFRPIDEPLLKVTMKCTGRSPGAPSKTATAELSNELSNPGSVQYDTFTFARKTFPEQQLDNANCTINASAGTDYTPVTPILFSNLSVSNGSAYTDRVVNFTLAKPPVETFEGTTFWIDPRDNLTPPTSIPVGGVTLTSLGAGAIVDFQANISGPDQTELEPEPTFAVVKAESDNTTGPAEGTWEFDGPQSQIIGETLYRVEAPNGEFLNGTIKVTIDENGDRTVIAVAGVLVTGDDASGFDIEMLPPEPGTLSGTLRILTTDLANSAEVTVEGYAPANDPNGAVPTATPDESGKFPAGGFKYLSAAAGTWTVDLTAPPNHEFLPRQTLPAELRSEVFVPPKGDGKLSATLVELGQINLTWGSSDGSPIPAPTVTATSTAVGPQPSPSITSTASTAVNAYEILGFPVTVDDTVNPPVFNDSEFAVTFQAAGFDSKVQLLKFQAGSKDQITVKLEPYGSIRGLILGERAGGQPPTGLDITRANGATVEIEYSKTVAGPFATSNVIPTKPAGSALGTFEFSGPPGYYRILVSHPEFKPEPKTIPTNPVSPALPEFEMKNIIDNDTSNASTTPWVLAERRTDLVVSTYTTLAKTAARDVKYTLTHADPVAFPTIFGTCVYTVPTTPCVISDLAAVQQYTLRLESIAGQTAAFPAVTTIVAPRTTANSFRQVEVTAFLPSLDSSITAQVIGENSNGDPVAAPAVDITTDFDASLFKIIVKDNNGSNDQPNDADGTFTLPVATPVSASRTDYLFPAVPTGTHTVTASPVAPGFRPLGTNQVTLAVPGVPPIFTYIAENVTLTAVLTDDNGGGDYPALSWTLTSPAGTSYDSGSWNTTCTSISPFPAQCPLPAWNFDEATNRLTITGVPPELNMFTLTVDDDLHTPTTWNGNIAVLGDGAGTRNIALTPVPDAARLTGKVTQFEGTGSPVDLPTAGSINLRDSAGTVVPAVLPLEAYTGNGLYQRTVALAGYANPADTFTLFVSNTDFTPIERQVSMQFGSVTYLDVNINKRATIDVIVARDLAGVSPVSPPGLDVYLTTQSGLRVNPVPGFPLRFAVDAGGPGYAVQVTAADYPTTFSEPTTGYFVPAVGSSTTKVVALPRLVLVTVTGASPALVTATIGTTTMTQTGGPSFRFEYAPGSAGASGAGTLVISAPDPATAATTTKTVQFFDDPITRETVAMP
jgi:hypothetical protein